MRYFSTFISGLRQFKSKLIEIVETGQSTVENMDSTFYGLRVAESVGRWASASVT